MNAKVEIFDDAPPELSMGKYKTFLSVEFGKNLTASVHDTAFFYVMPLQQIILIFAAVLIVSIVIALYVHRRYAVEGDYDDEFTADVPMYISSERSDSKDHDIDLSKKE